MKRNFFSKLICLLLLAASTLLYSVVSFAETYSVKVTNVTRGMKFTPRLLTVHTAGNLFVLGEPAFDEIVTIAESGNIEPAQALLESSGSLVTSSAAGEGLLDPGASQTVMIEGNPGELLSVIAMLIPTNDAFFAVDAVTLPTSGSVTVMANVYDAGSEPNDELCSNIPGPTCGGEASSPDVDGEGYVHIHAGIHGVGDLMAANYDWRNPGASVTITVMP